MTGMDKPVRIPLLIVPTPRTPVSGGANVTNEAAIGEKVLSGVVDSYNWAVMVTVFATSAKAAVVLK